MAEERNLGLARAPESGIEDDAEKAELQRRMEEARESITQTVTEIKDTVTNQYQHVRESINDALDWREQFRRRPVAFSVGAAGLGVVLGYSLGSAFAGDSRHEDYDNDDEDYESPSETTRSYAAQPITGSHQATATAYSRSEPAHQEEESRPSYSSGYAGSPAAHKGYSEPEEEPEGPGLFERFKGTRAYDRLQSELSKVGERLIDELAKTAETVVLPLLLNKVKNLIGVDLSASSGHQAGGTRSGGQEGGVRY